MMKKLGYILCSLYMVFNVLEAQVTHQKNIEQEWKESDLSPFDELMLTWNGKRPTEGKYFFYVSVKVEEWSPWLLYASWGSDGQASYLCTTQEAPVRVYQDALGVLEGRKATGFKIKIVSEGNAPLDNLSGLHVYTNNDSKESQQAVSYELPVYLQVKGLSQMTVNHVRHKDLCSPTSTTAVIRYLLNDYEIDPIHFAQNSWDAGFDIFGNWVFNVVQASTELGPNWNCWVDRLSSFDAIYQRLHQGTPVIVSVRGPLVGSALPYAKGHLMAVIGYDPLTQKVICMDPAFPSDAQTHVFYPLSDFVEAWSRRGKVAYIFSKEGE